ncbi:MAG: nitroreductase family protein [Lautropia sp.]|nr:nitroreductase family protein [Lautropia sp.]
MPVHPTLQLIENRASINHFDDGHQLDDATITALVNLATRAPSAYNLQNWRFIAVRSTGNKTRLRALAFEQSKVADASVCFIICGRNPDASSLPALLQPAVDAGSIPAGVPLTWQTAARTSYANPVHARDEVIRSASLAAGFLMLAAEAMGLASAPMTGFDTEGVCRAFGLSPDEIPVILLAVGKAGHGNAPQKPRRPVSEVLDLA